MDLSLNLEDTHVLITGGSGYIGSATVTALLSAGCCVTSLDLKCPPAEHASNHLFRFINCNITSESDLEEAFDPRKSCFGQVNACIALASLDLSVLEHHESLADMSVQQWRRTHEVNVEGTFLTARTWLRSLRSWVKEFGGGDGERSRDGVAVVAGDGDGLGRLKNVSLVIVGSESGVFGERGNADYAAGKSAVQVGLLKSLAADAVRIYPHARVNAVAPGPVDTEQFKRECAANPDQYWLDAEATVAMKKPVPPEQVAKSILFLLSESWSGSICGQVIRVDSGKQGKVLWLKEEI